MPKYSKPPYVNNIWADGAVEGNIELPSESKYDTGWIQEKPPYENENAINNKHDSYIAYINQAGIPEWDSETEYQSGKSYVQASDGRIYKCIQTNNNRNPATSGNGSYWELFEGNRQATTSERGTTMYATDSQVASGQTTTRAITPSNISAICNLLFPVGSTVMRRTNPGSVISSGGFGVGNWTRITGRSIIGTGSYNDGDTSRSFSEGNSYGEFEHQLTINEMPRHRHLLPEESGGNSGRESLVDNPNNDQGFGNEYSDYSGGNSPHNNLHPVFAVPIWYRTS